MENIDVAFDKAKFVIVNRSPSPLEKALLIPDIHSKLQHYPINECSSRSQLEKLANIRYGGWQGHIRCGQLGVVKLGMVNQEWLQEL